MKIPTLIACGAALCLDAAAAAVDTPDEQAVVAAMQGWEAAVESGDYEALAGFYTEDAVFYPNGVAPIVGRDRILERNRQRGSRGAVNIMQRVDDVEVNGNWAVYSCLARVEATASEGTAPAARFSRVLLLMERGEDGRWRIHRDIDNETPETWDGN